MSFTNHVPRSMCYYSSNWKKLRISKTTYLLENKRDEGFYNTLVCDKI